MLYSNFLHVTPSHSAEVTSLLMWAPTRLQAPQNGDGGGHCLSCSLLSSHPRDSLHGVQWILYPLYEREHEASRPLNSNLTAGGLQSLLQARMPS